MSRGIPWSWVALTGLLLLAPSVQAFHPQPLPDGHLLQVTHSPDPVPGDSHLTVTAELASAEEVEGAWLKYCLSENRNATLCYVPVALEQDGSAYRATTEHPLPPNQEFGYNLTIEYRDGTTQYYPSGNHTPSNAYVFLTTEPAARNAPGAHAIILTTLFLGGALVTRRLR